MRRDPRDFSRGGPLSPQLLTTLLVFMVADSRRRGYQHLLEGFWDEARAYGLPLPTEEPISAAAFCAARPKITPQMLRDMIHRVAAMSREETREQELWHGRRVFAVDGTKFNLQRGHDLEAAFGVPEGAYCPQVLMSIMLDVCAGLPIDVEIAPFASCEREQLFEMLPSLAEGDVLVLDRGYPCHELLQHLAADGIDFLVRVPSSHTFSAIDELRESRGNDYLFRIDPPAGSPPEWETLVLRGVRLKGPDGSESFFLTSLRRGEFSRSQLRELYHMRWQAEEHFKLLKGPYIGQGQFRSKSLVGVHQEIHALVLFLAIARVLMITAARSAGTDCRGLRQKAAVLGLADYATRLFLSTADPDYALRELQAVLERIARTPYKRRRRRAPPRVSFRPRLRWGPSGRVGG